MTFLEKLCAALAQDNICYALVGGHAVALHGAVRGTVDIDLVLDWQLTTLAKTETIFAELGLISRLPISAHDIFNFRDEYIKNRNLIAWNFYNPNDLTRQVDIIITYDLKPAEIETKSLPSTDIQLLSIKPLIAMKSESGRPQDLEDIAALKRIQAHQ